MDLMQNLAKPCKLFIWGNLTDFALSRSPILYIDGISRILPLFEGFLSPCEEQRPTCQHAEAVENAPLN
jgi:hypothetical protein